MDKRPDRYRNAIVPHIYIEGAAQAGTHGRLRDGSRADRLHENPDPPRLGV